jgi:hypothetical protein
LPAIISFLLRDIVSVWARVKGLGTVAMVDVLMIAVSVILLAGSSMAFEQTGCYLGMVTPAFSQAWISADPAVVPCQ